MEKTIYTDEYRAMLKWLRLQREQHGLTMRDLAARIGVHHSWIGRIELGERRLDISEFVRVCMAIGCDPYQGLKIVVPPQGRRKLKKGTESKSVSPRNRKRNRRA